MRKIPVNIITGFLGAGKTTAIINLLSQKTTDDLWAVIINEFGKISIDTQTLQSASDSENVYEIAGGCICCTAKGYLNETLQAVIQFGKYSRIIIEPTGLGGVDMVSEIVESHPNLILKPVICLVDIQCVQKPRLMMIPIFRAQITKSDWIVFTKSDLILDPSLLKDLKQQFLVSFPNAIVADEINLPLLEGIVEKKNSAIFQPSYSYLNTDLSTTGFREKNYTFEASTVFDSKKLEVVFLNHPSIIRLKGYINTEKGWKLINYTLSECKFEPSNVCNQTQLVVITDKLETDLEKVLKNEICKAIISI